MKHIKTYIVSLAVMAGVIFTPQVFAGTVDDFFVVDQFNPAVQTSFGFTPGFAASPFVDQTAQINQLLQIISQLQAQLDAQRLSSNNFGFTNSGFSPSNFSAGSPGFGFVETSGNTFFGGSSSTFNDDEPRAITLTPRDVEEDSVELRGEVDMNDFRNGIVFFVYGQDEDMIEDVEDDYDEYDDVRDDEENDDFEVVRVDNDLDGDDRYDEEVNNLEEDEDYYYIICVEYEDDDNDETLECGSVRDFETDGNSSNNDDEPEAETVSAVNVDNNSATLRGDIDMNDFDNGLVFFVWGEDEDQVEEVEDEDRYSDIDTDGDDLRRAIVNNNFDGDDSFNIEVFSLDGDTDIYFRICVEYRDEDNDNTLECGNVREFETD